MAYAPVPKQRTAPQPPAATAASGPKLLALGAATDSSAGGGGLSFDRCHQLSVAQPIGGGGTAGRKSIDHFTAAGRAAGAHALLAAALEATATEAGVNDIDASDGYNISASRFSSSGSGGENHLSISSGQHHLSTGRTHASTGGLGRAVLSAAGEGGRAEALIVDAVVAAAVEWRRAVDLAPDHQQYAAELIRAATAHLADAPRRVLLEQGAEAAVQWFEKDKWANAPEYVRPRPKYYYFYESMKARIGEHYPSLPEKVMDKLLALDAGELDLLLQYPKAIQGQVEEYLDVYRSNGGKYLDTYRTPQLSWEEVKAMKGRGTVGLGAEGEVNGYGESGPPPASKRLAGIEADDEDTDRAMLGAGGDDGLTAEEAAGLLMNSGGSKPGRGPSLPPDQLRVAHHTAQSHAAGNTKYLTATSANSAVGAGASAVPNPPVRSKRMTAILGAVKDVVGGSAPPPAAAATVAAHLKNGTELAGADQSEAAVAATTAVEKGGTPSAAFTIHNMDDMD